MDISAEVAAIQAASQGSELRQPIVDALTTLNSGTLPVVTSSDAGKILKVGANGWEVGEKSGYMPVPTSTKQITENGTHDVTNYASAVVNVSGGGGSVLVPKTIVQNGVYDPANDNADGYSSVTVDIPTNSNWKDSFSVNWDFADPVNTRGGGQYSSNGLVYTIDGWQLQGGKLSFVTGGITLERYASNTAGFFMQRYKSAATTAMVGKPFTLSLIVDGILASASYNIPSANSGTTATSASGVYFRIWNYGQEIAITIDIAVDTGSHTIQAIKLESGNTQTLATQVNGIWVLNNSMDKNTEYIRARYGIIYD